MCENIEFDIDEDSLKIMAVILRARVANTVSDKCSMEIFDETEINELDDLIHAVGMTMFNSVVVGILVDQIARVEENAEED